MAFINRFFAKSKQEIHPANVVVDQADTSKAMGVFDDWSTSVSVNPNARLTNSNLGGMAEYYGVSPWLGIVVNKLASDIVNSDWWFESESGDIIIDSDIKNRSKILSSIFFEKNKYGASFKDTMSCFVFNYLMTGNGVLFKYSNSTASRFNLFTGIFSSPSKNVTILFDTSNGGISGYRLSDSSLGFSGSVTLDTQTVIHERYNSFLHPLIGVPPAAAITKHLYTSSQLADSASVTAKNLGIPSIIFVVNPDREITTKQAMEIEQNLKEKYSRKSASGQAKLAIVDDVVIPNTPNVYDAYLGMINDECGIACSVYGVPKTVLGLGSANYATANIDVEMYNSGVLSANIGWLEDVINDNIVSKIDSSLIFKIKRPKSIDYAGISSLVQSGGINSQAGAEAVGFGPDNNVADVGVPSAK